MDAHEVVIERVQGDRCGVVVNFLAEGVGQSSKAAHVYAHGEIATLGVWRADVLAVGLADNNAALRADALGWAISRLSLRIRP